MRSVLRQTGVVLMLGLLSLSHGLAADRIESVATGTFEVQMSPVGENEPDSGVAMGRFVLTKVFSGDMDGESSGEMLTAMTPVPGSAGYVAIERFAGSLAGLEGSFMLQHSGTMQGDVRALTIAIVPDSGTGDLTGLDGTFHLEMVDGVHHYELRYSLVAD
ncbi:MAG: DUF3224 domain-containing protein [Pseudomonadota bacterium]